MKTNTIIVPQKSFFSSLWRDIKQHRAVYAMMIPVLLYYFIFCYKPMYGALIAFQDYSPTLGVTGSPWVGFKHFEDFFGNPDFVRILKNTLIISVTSLVVGFPAPILLALLFNEVVCKQLKRVAQTISYIPHFISLVVVCGLIKQFVSPGGFIYDVFVEMTGAKAGLLSDPNCFVPIYVISNIWQGCGWDSIIYLAALSAIDPGLYEAAKVDGAGKLRQIWHVTLPGIAPTIIILLILRVGSLMSLGYEKIILLQNPAIYSTSDVISTYVYRIGITQQAWSYSTAVGHFNSLINIILVVASNKISKIVTGTSLW